MAEKLTEYRNYMRLAALEKAGVLTLNEDMSIRTIGKSQLTMDQFVAETGRQYQAEFTAATAVATKRFNNGEIPAWMVPLKGKLPDNMLVGFLADQTSQGNLRVNWLRSEGIPEFAGSVVQINRNLYDPEGTINAQGSRNYTAPEFKGSLPGMPLNEWFNAHLRENLAVVARKRGSEAYIDLLREKVELAYQQYEHCDAAEARKTMVQLLDLVHVHLSLPSKRQLDELVQEGKRTG